MAGFDPHTSTRIRRRLILCGTVFVTLLVGVLARAVHLQLTLGDRLKTRAVNQYIRDVELTPRRGAIVDRQGHALATSVEADSVFVVPKVVRETKGLNVAAMESSLAKVLHLEPELVHRRMTAPGSFQWLKRRISPQESVALKSLHLDKSGIQTVREFRRFYPGKRLAAHVVGTVGVDEDGLEGIEKQEDELLSGDSHAVRSVRDVKGNLLAEEGDLSQSSLSGARVELTIDSTIQQATEQALNQEMAVSQAIGGMVVVMDPRTGAVLALASAPGFNPNAPGDVANRRDRPVSDSYEPGSVMKCFLLAGAIADRLVTPETMVDVTGGQLHIGKKTIHDSHKPEHDRETVAEVLAHSSNVGAGRIGLLMGAERLTGWFRSFGFGERTGLGLPGEAHGVVANPERMGEIATATTAFGQGMTASGVQIAAALSALANDGRLMRPYVVQRVVQPDGHTLVDHKAEMVRQVVSPEVAHTVAKMMVGVVEKGGTGVKAAIPGVEVAGKTGTAQKADAITHAYGGKRFSSFMGFAPAQDPRVAIYVAFDEPQGEKYGGDVAAPVFKSIMTAALLELGVAPSAPSPAPAATNHKAVKSAAPVEPQTEELDDGFEDTTPDSGDDEPPTEGSVQASVVPDLKGCSARSSLRLLHDRSLDAVLEGFGRVVAQRPEPGKHVPPGTRVRVSLGAG
jgi:cell division protein FtsI (penicillin-binding protein 3)